jgi:predicted TIM-barrel fold metal-dependent hydrolase
VSPALEAFGYQRIIFGSSPSRSSNEKSSVKDWYELARESFAELGIEQEGIDAIFYENAKGVYGPGSSQ